MKISVNAKGLFNASNIEELIKSSYYGDVVDMASFTVKREWVGIAPNEIIIKEDGECYVEITNQAPRDVILLVQTKDHAMCFIHLKTMFIGTTGSTYGMELIKETPCNTKLCIGSESVSVLVTPFCQFEDLKREYPALEDWELEVPERTTLASIYEPTKEKELVPLLEVSEKTLIQHIISGKHVIPKHLELSLFPNVKDIHAKTWKFYKANDEYIGNMLNNFFRLPGCEVDASVDLIISNTEGFRDYSYLSVCKEEKLQQQGMTLRTYKLYMFRNGVDEEFGEIYSRLAQTLEDGQLDFLAFITDCVGKLVIDYIEREGDGPYKPKEKVCKVRFETMKDVEKELEEYKKLGYEVDKLEEGE